MDHIEVDTQTMGNDIAAMEEALKKAVNQTKGLLDDMESLNSMWTGIGHDAYMNQFHKDCEKMNDANKTFNDYLERLDKAKKEYCSGEKTVSGIIRSLWI